MSSPATVSGRTETTGRFVSAYSLPFSTQLPRNGPEESRKWLENGCRLRSTAVRGPFGVPSPSISSPQPLLLLSLFGFTQMAPEIPKSGLDYRDFKRSICRRSPSDGHGSEICCSSPLEKPSDRSDLTLEPPATVDGGFRNGYRCSWGIHVELLGPWVLAGSTVGAAVGDYWCCKMGFLNEFRIFYVCT